MASFNSASLTKKGMALLAKAQVRQEVIRFTKAATGDGTYTEEDVLADMTGLKEQQQEFPISTISIVDNSTVYLKFIVSNYHESVALLKGYHVTEVGIFAEDPDEGEILYTIATAVSDQSDYLPEYNNLLPSTITMEFYTTVANAAEVSIKAKSGAYVYQDDYEEYKQEMYEELRYVKNPVFEDYTESEVPEPEMAINEITSEKNSKVLWQYVKASLKGLLNLAQKALSVAMGRNQARVFATVAALDTWLAVPENVEQLKVGDNFYITATDVPDYWWDGLQKQKLETQKVDLTTYDQRIAANASAISQLNGNITSHNHAWSAITGRTPGTLKTIASNKKVSVANGWKFVNLASFKVPPGVWMLLVQAYWDPSSLTTVAQNARGLYISNSTTSISGQADERIVHESNYAHQMFGIMSESTEKTYYILAKQNFSGSLGISLNAVLIRLD